ncbi:MAG: membrane integrity-associated transporter subunit PqiC [Deltaproteobacteria bacterium]|nr:membrane integrity-associated transporter subunit PqiC [Deltaproteobacteria bacterium]
MLLASLGALFISGCSFALPERTAPPRTYVLSVNPHSAKTSFSSNSNRKGTLLVGLPRAIAGFDTPRMAYLLRPHELSYYADNQWVDTPARMLAPLLAKAMELTEVWDAVVQAPNPVRADYRLDGDNLLLEQQFFSRPSRIRLKLSLQLVELRGRKVMGSHDFEIWEETPSDDAYGGVIASNRATERLLEEAVKWVRATLKAGR